MMIATEVGYDNTRPRLEPAWQSPHYSTHPPLYFLDTRIGCSTEKDQRDQQTTRGGRVRLLHPNKIHIE